MADPLRFTRAPFDFDGGIAVQVSRRSRGGPLERLSMPREFRLPLHHRSARLDPLVKRGSIVLKGERIASGEVDLHAPTSGRIAEVRTLPAAHPAAIPVSTLVLVPDGDDRWHPSVRPPRHPPATVSGLVDALRHAGVAGLGGAGFPTLTKLARASARNARPVLVVNAVESEPDITSDEALLVHHADEVLAGVALLARPLGIERAIIALDPSNAPVRAGLRAAWCDRVAATVDGIDVAIECTEVPPRFPAGSERQLVQALGGVRLAHGQRPVDIGWLVHNPATLRALYRALAFGEPLIERVVTITGSAIAAPVHAWARIGHPIADAVAPYLATSQPIDVLHGGAVTGWLVHPDAAIGKQTYGLHVQGAKHASPEAPCINCGRCEDACPERLPPQVLLRIV
jgi:Na+-translocating ferredoxin:NAD+ oxidoreductase subunit C